jgi:hypothetical protein
MCLSYCQRLGLLYWNHEDCWVELCPFAAGPHGRCDDCQHRQDKQCGLTLAPLPVSGGCCHWNVTPKNGWQEITRQTLAPLQIGRGESEIAVLESLDVSYQVGAEGEIRVDLDSLNLPFIFGLGTENEADTVFDWSAWSGQWTCD